MNKNDTPKQASALDILQGHFAGIEKNKIEVELIPFPMFSDPLNTEDYLTTQHINTQKDPARKARQMARFIASKVKLKDGTPAFTSKKGNTAEILATLVEPKVLFEIFAQMFDAETAEEVEELEKKSEATEKVS
eukprot:Seg17282.2 transcript_id=Seg17282.2/GoldUCD/mRNA.D3Y31 product="hypothetical protein" protein_id=Seg17282.2/GoldUCD/D3Y31